MEENKNIDTKRVQPFECSQPQRTNSNLYLKLNESPFDK